MCLCYFQTTLYTTKQNKTSNNTAFNNMFAITTIIVLNTFVKKVIKFLFF